eukprot:3531914-Amphidinium_carterae.1
MKPTLSNVNGIVLEKLGCKQLNLEECMNCYGWAGDDTVCLGMITITGPDMNRDGIPDILQQPGMPYGLPAVPQQQAMPMPMQAAPMPMQAAPMPMQAAPMPMQAAPMSMQAAPMPMQVVPMSMQQYPMQPMQVRDSKACCQAMTAPMPMQPMAPCAMPAHGCAIITGPDMNRDGIPDCLQGGSLAAFLPEAIETSCGLAREFEKFQR